jgi:hypothetical protein
MMEVMHGWIISWPIKDAPILFAQDSSMIHLFIAFVGPRDINTHFLPRWLMATKRPSRFS